MTKDKASNKVPTDDESLLTTATIDLSEFVNAHIDSGIQVVARGLRIEFSCQKGFHYGKYATGSGSNRKREQIGKLEVVADEGYSYRIREYLARHKCHYPDKEYREAVRTYGEGQETTVSSGRGRVSI